MAELGYPAVCDARDAGAVRERKLYEVRLLIPAVWLQREPALKKWFRCTYSCRAVHLRWRLPWDGRGQFVRVRPKDWRGRVLQRVGLYS